MFFVIFDDLSFFLQWRFFSGSIICESDSV